MMHNHEPTDYDCPFCRRINNTDPTHPNDIVYQDDHILSLISKDWWPNNPGHVLIVPKEHIENIYTLPFHLSDRIHRFAKCVALALKELYRCDGVSTRQHNEPAGDQDVWHYHLHIFPRYEGDNLYRERKAEAKMEDRVAYATQLRTYFSQHKPDLD